MLQRRIFNKLIIAVIVLMIFASATGLMAGGQQEAPAQAELTEMGDPNKVLTLGDQNNAVFTRNFNPFITTCMLGARNMIHEPLMIFNSVKGELVPWLAESYSWSDDLLTLTLDIRKGVKWSDGVDFTANDVAFTFNMIKTKPGVNSSILSALVGDNAFIDSITAVDDYTVEFSFNRAYTPGLYELITENIVPEHVWGAVDDVVAFTNENPVGTGPFTEITQFSDQVFEISKNPYYWQEGKPKFRAVVWKAYGDNNAAALAMVNGEIDWSNYALADPENSFVKKDAANRHLMYEEGPNMAVLELNTEVKPFDDINVRKAFSMALNREQISLIGEAGIVRPTDVTGLTHFYDAWKVSEPASLADWATYNPEKANQLLDAAGLKKGSDGIRLTADGKKMSYEVQVLPAPNWIASLQIASDNLKEVGVELRVTPQPVFPEWLMRGKLGTYDVHFAIMDGNATPYRFYRNTLSAELLVPQGVPAEGNYSRYKGAAAENELARFARSTNVSEQKDIVLDLQEIFAAEVPAVPFVALGGQGLINTKNFGGFPTADNYYASVQPNPAYFSDCLLVLTEIYPK